MGTDRTMSPTTNGDEPVWKSTRFYRTLTLGGSPRGRGPVGPTEQALTGVLRAGRGAGASQRRGRRRSRSKPENSDTALGNWVKADRAGRGEPDCTGLLPLTEQERAELTRLRRKNGKLKTEREILKRAAACFVTELTT